MISEYLARVFDLRSLNTEQRFNGQR